MRMWGAKLTLQIDELYQYPGKRPLATSPIALEFPLLPGARSSTTIYYVTVTRYRDRITYEGLRHGRRRKR